MAANVIRCRDGNDWWERKVKAKSKRISISSFSVFSKLDAMADNRVSALLVEVYAKPLLPQVDVSSVSERLLRERGKACSSDSDEIAPPPKLSIDSLTDSLNGVLAPTGEDHVGDALGRDSDERKEISFWLDRSAKEDLSASDRLNVSKTSQRPRQKNSPGLSFARTGTRVTLGQSDVHLCSSAYRRRCCRFRLFAPLHGMHRTVCFM
jgi:hypothetical protein